MHDAVTTTTLILLTLVALLASAAAIHALLTGRNTDRHRRAVVSLIGLCAAGSLGLFVYRLLLVHHDWAPLSAHVDGLVLIAALLAPTIAYLHARSRVPNIAAFALPVLALVLAWGICASAWTLRLFEIGSVWNVAHLGCVYVGTVFFAVAAVCGAMYLYAQRRLHKKIDLANPRRVASLELIEKLIISMSVLGFALLTLGMALGLVIISSRPHEHPGWWYSWKIVLAAVAWLVYALLTNVRHATGFRGSRAAWLAIAGLLLLLAVFSLANLPASGPDLSRAGAAPGALG